MSFLHNLNLKRAILAMVCVLWVGLGQTKLIAQCPTSASVVAVASGDVCLGATVYYYAEVTGDSGPFTYSWCAYNNSTGTGTCFNGFDDNTSATPSRTWMSSTGPKSVQVTISKSGCTPIISTLYAFNAVEGPAPVVGTVTDTICTVENPMDLTSYQEDISIQPGVFEYYIDGVLILDPTAYMVQDTDIVIVSFTDDATGCSNSTVMELILRADDPDPVVTCPDDMIIQLSPLQCDSLINFDDATVTDVCTPLEDIDLESDVLSGTVFGIGTTTVTFTATDGSGNTGTCSFNIIVNEYVNPNLGCKPVQVSVDDNCEALLTATLVLTGYEIDGEILLGCDDSWDINVISGLGNNLGALIDASLVGKTLMYSIENVNSGWRCMNTVAIEDKLPPTIECDDITVSCLSDIENLVTAEAIDNCTATSILVNEVHIPLDCEAYIGKIERKYIAKDLYGNQSEPCTATIYLERSSVAGVVSPVNAVLQCSDTFVEDDRGFGYPAPSVTGVPRLGGYPLYPTSQLSTLYCNATIDYTDQLVLSTSCKTRIIRTWRIVEWWCSSTVELFVGMQMIDIIDNVGPVIPHVNDITVSTKSTSCDATITVPTLTITDNCQGIQKVYVNAYNTADNSSTGYIDTNGGKLVLPVGVHEVVYTAFDACGNSSENSYTVTVRDNTSPVALCDQFNTVSLKNNGYTEITAVSVDDGSMDECSDVVLKIRRVDDPCNFEQTEGWYDKVGFCCLDANTSPMVQLLVTDAGGNTNMCMVSVKVQDKVTASMECPDSFEIDECGYTYDANDPDFYFGAPTLIDNCPSNLNVVNTLDDQRSACGVGSIYRTIELFEGSKLLQTCSQVISVVNPTPFDGNTGITWPKNYTVLGQCQYDGLVPESLPEGSQYPVFSEGVCDLVGFRYEDEVYPFTTNGACYKIIRNWTVIDWCQRDDNGSPLTWKYEQEIKVMDNTPPTITPQSDYYECSYDPACVGGHIDVVAEATDCTPSDELKWSYTITQGGTYYSSGHTADASGIYPIGIYHIRYTVEDRCGNQSALEFNFEVRNCKSPVAVCKEGLAAALTLMDTPDGRLPMVMLSPEFFDNKSSHPCDNYAVQLSFSSNTDDILRTFDCEDIGKQEIELWVTDQNGNTSFCSTFVDIQDNDYICSKMPEFWGCNTIAASCSPGNFNNNSQSYPDDYVLAIVKNDRTCDFLPLDSWGPSGTTYEDKIYHGPAFEWTLGNLGTVFGLAIDNDGNIYAGASTVFGSQEFPDGTAPDQLRGSGSIYKIDALTGGVNTEFVTTYQSASYNAAYAAALPNQTLTGTWGAPLGEAWTVKTGAGLGDLTFDRYNNKLFVSNFEDGKIYKINPSTGVIENVYDPRFGDASAAGLDNGALGFAPRGQRPWGLGINQENSVIKLYYALWNVDLRDDVPTNTKHNQIWSVQLDADGNPMPSTEALELVLPYLEGSNTYYMSNPVSDISFNTSGEMLVAERGMLDDFGIPYHTTGVNPAHHARIMRFQNPGSGWQVYISNNYYALNVSAANSSGGIDYGTYVCDGETFCDDMMWATVDAYNLDGTLSVYGVADVNYSNGAYDVHSYIDLDSDLENYSKLGVGDVEAYNCDCSVSGRKSVISGSISNMNDVKVVNVEVILDGSEQVTVNTNNAGQYTFGEIEKGGNYQVHASKNDDVLNGVSTVDLVMIQRHILGIESLTSPYQYIAADINNNKAITVGDLTEMRKVILGDKMTFSNNTSWRFVDKNYVFNPDLNPLAQSFTELYNIDLLSNDMNIDFVAVKVGDLNMNAICNSQSESSEVRSASGLVLNDQSFVKGQIFDIDVLSGSSDLIAGLQAKLEFNGLSIIDISEGTLDVSKNDVLISGNTLGIAYAAKQMISAQKGDKLFTVKVKALVSGKLSDYMTLSDAFSNEIYTNENLNIEKLNLRFSNNEDLAGVTSIRPNPWTQQTTLNFDLNVSGLTDIRVYDFNGKLVAKKSMDLIAGNQNIRLDRVDVPNTGMYMFEIKSNDQLIRGKMLIVD
ncbi:MAG: HYR domain-containing protein [Lewinellaceae bacterium]|nr:HYR domain-containing protein [Lewinellaceae bacterium]